VLVGARERETLKEGSFGRVAVNRLMGAEQIMKAGLHFIVLAGGVEAARERLVGLEELIEAAKAVE
jgi:hypothetical protein